MGQQRTFCRGDGARSDRDRAAPHLARGPAPHPARPGEAGGEAAPQRGAAGKRGAPGRGEDSHLRPQGPSASWVEPCSPLRWSWGPEGSAQMRPRARGTRREVSARKGPGPGALPAPHREGRRVGCAPEPAGQSHTGVLDPTPPPGRSKRPLLRPLSPRGLRAAEETQTRLGRGSWARVTALSCPGPWPRATQTCFLLGRRQ